MFGLDRLSNSSLLLFSPENSPQPSAKTAKKRLLQENEQVESPPSKFQKSSSGRKSICSWSNPPFSFSSIFLRIQQFSLSFWAARSEPSLQRLYLQKIITKGYVPDLSFIEGAQIVLDYLSFEDPLIENLPFIMEQDELSAFFINRLAPINSLHYQEMQSYSKILPLFKVFIPKELGILKHFKNIRELNFNGSNINHQFHDSNHFEKIEDRDIVIITKNCPNLVSLNISGCFNLTDNSFFALAATYSQFSALNASRCKMTNQGVLACINQWSHLKYLNLGYCRNLNDQLMITVSIKCKELKHLHMTHKYFTKMSLKALAMGCQKLQYLNIDFWPTLLDTDFTAVIRNLPMLKELYAPYASDKDVANLKKEFPNLVLNKYTNIEKSIDIYADPT